MNNIQSSLERIKRKQEELRKVKLKHRIKETKEEFEEYIKNLSSEENCKYVTGVAEIINLCNNILFKCKFKGEIYKSFTSNPKKECLRERILKFEEMLEH